MQRDKDTIVQGLVKVAEMEPEESEYSEEFGCPYSNSIVVEVDVNNAVDNGENANG